MKALVIQPAFIGDAILALALAEELRRLDPAAHINYMVRPEAADLIRLSPSVDQVITYDKYATESGMAGIRSKALDLNGYGFDAVFSLHTSKRTMLLLSMLKAPRKVGYGDDPVLTDRITPVDEPHTAKAVRLLTAFYPDVDLTTLPVISPSPGSLPRAFLELPHPIVVVAPDSVWRTKQWGAEKFFELCKRLSASGVSVVLVGKKSDSANYHNGKSLENNVLNLLSKTSLEELAAVVSASDLLVSNDSAPVHISTAARTPSVVVFGPTIPGFGFAPPPEIGLVIENEKLWCRPCSSHGSNECPTHTHECMTSISAEDVFAQVMSRLSILKKTSVSR